MMGGDQHDGFVGSGRDADQRRTAFVRRLGEAITGGRKFFPRKGFDVGSGPEPEPLLDRGGQPRPRFFGRQNRRQLRFQEDAPGNGGVAVEPDDAVRVVGGELGHRLSVCRR
ncbi:hypothetical protein SD37_24525 [Amycolatopsis orientalis]|uniref:Uncharacterized protein n=1 Tax=Amycolatopsis orientalis TaxID=31958 RepID=A0A193C1X2_AMYOR|nr:hypothetical protein SD37_24525 [Amycolatopsis orientalis]